MGNILLSPPVAFVIVLLVSLLLSFAAIFLAYRPEKVAKGFEKAYTGGEEIKTHRVQPDYTQFFPFAFFFTILHIVCLMLVTIPKETLGTFIIAVMYLSGAILGLIILFRR
ncbi:MAG: hypothetical protein NT030_04580 [Candidatus Saganbacteria bacterium]|nr:hypothetical protein [Candidatus Saganbacteria bacterium]